MYQSMIGYKDDNTTKGEYTLEAFGDVFDAFFGKKAVTKSYSFWDREKMILSVVVPGFSAKDITVALNSKTLTIDGHNGSAWKDYHSVVTLPPEVDFRQAEASIKDGILYIEFKKRSIEDQITIQVTEA